MKKYKDENKNNKVREIVREYKKSPFGLGHKYCTSEEWEIDIMNRFNISHGMAVKVREIIRADAYHDDIALEVWGFNQHTA